MGRINTKYALGRCMSTGRSVLNDVRQLFNPYRNAYKRYENLISINRLYFEVTNICNAKCIFCAYPSVRHKTGTMKFEIFRKAVDEWSRMGGKNVSFTPTVGDPLIDPGLIKKVKYAAGLKGIGKVYFYTNGILLRKDRLYKKLVDSGINEIHISMGETDKEAYERIHGVKVYDDVIEGVSRLLAYNKSKGSRVRICLDFRPASDPERVLKSPDFVKYIAPFLGRNVKYSFMYDYDNWGGVIKKEHLIGIMKLRRVPRFKILPCVRTFDAAVLFDGSVRLCACRVKYTEFDDLVVGNIEEHSLEDIFYGRKAKGIRERFTENNHPAVCKDCSLYMPADTKWLRERARLSEGIRKSSLPQ